MKAIILCGGNSTRYGKNKLLTEFHGKTLPEYNIDFCQENGISDILVTISRNHVEINDKGKLVHPIIERLTKYAKETYETEPKKVNVSFKFQDNDKYGPAAGLIPWMDKLKDDVLVLFGDNFLRGKFDFKEYLGKGFDAVATYKDLPKSNSNERFGAIDESPTHFNLVEKPHLYREGKFFIGFSFYSAKGFQELIKLKPSIKRNEYEITEFFNSIDRRTIAPVVEHWIDLTYQNDDTLVNDVINKSF